jgi:hypothetical protein
MCVVRWRDEDRTVNRLAKERSPYLLQHAANPVDWYAWGEEAFARARSEDKPIFLSIGYSTCHWCHVMEHESFENPAIAELLNRDYVSIKVDREERPDVDRVYMAFVQATTGSGGWPMSVFLTPELKPFFGGTISAGVEVGRSPGSPRRAGARMEESGRASEAATELPAAPATVMPLTARRAESELAPADTLTSRWINFKGLRSPSWRLRRRPKFPRPCELLKRAVACPPRDRRTIVRVSA